MTRQNKHRGPRVIVYKTQYKHSSFFKRQKLPFIDLYPSTTSTAYLYAPPSTQLLPANCKFLFLKQKFKNLYDKKHPNFLAFLCKMNLILLFLDC